MVSSVVGGLVGKNYNSSSIDNSYATGSVSGSTDVGGLIGNDDGTNTLTNNWWYNSLSQGIGNNGSNTSSGHWQEASSASDFYSSHSRCIQLGILTASGLSILTNTRISCGRTWETVLPLSEAAVSIHFKSLT